MTWKTSFSRRGQTSRMIRRILVVENCSAQVKKHLKKMEYHFDGVKLSAICFNKWEEHFPYVITDFARDAALEEAWDDFADVPMDPETECIEEPFLFFKAGTHREEIWHWFDEHHSKGVYWLLYERGMGK